MNNEKKRGKSQAFSICELTWAFLYPAICRRYTEVATTGNCQKTDCRFRPDLHWRTFTGV